MADGPCGCVFMWHGHELWVEAKRLEQGGKQRRWMGPVAPYAPWADGRESEYIGGTRHLPPELEPHREETLKDLYEALRVYRISGVFFKVHEFRFNV
jgi:hypothetical protein